MILEGVLVKCDCGVRLNGFDVVPCTYICLSQVKVYRKTHITASNVIIWIFTYLDVRHTLDQEQPLPALSL